MSKFLAIHETTIWKPSIGFKVPNHTYLVKGSHLYAYIQAGRCKPPIYLKKPVLFDKRDRTFSTLRGCPFDLSKIVSIGVANV